MVRNLIGKSPFPVETLDSDELITLEQIKAALKKKQGVSLCVRSSKGPTNRGGYFFHIQPVDDRFLVFDFEHNPVAELTSTHLVKFVNHVCGRQFDPEVFTYCQSVVNLRQDRIDDATEA